MQRRKRKLVVEQAEGLPLQLAFPEDFPAQKGLVEMETHRIDGLLQAVDHGISHA